MKNDEMTTETQSIRLYVQHAYLSESGPLVGTC